LGYDANGVLGYLNDVWQYGPASNPPVAATPTFSPTAGTYASAQTVTISDGTTGATIYYTTDGSTPTYPISGSTAAYTAPISVAPTETVKAVAIAANYSVSAVGSATYTLAPAAATPSFSPGTGTYTSTQTVTISEAITGATIYYTTDGSTPTTGSVRYTGAISVSSTETLKAIASAGSYSMSNVATASYAIPPDFTISVSPASITVASGKSGTTTVTVTDEGGFDSNITLGCSGLPSGATCSFSTETPPTTAGVTETLLTISTLSTTAAVHRNGRPLFPASALAIALCCFGWKKRRHLRVLLLLAVSVTGMSLLNGCAEVIYNDISQSATTTITISAASGSLTHSTQFSLTVN
jgi:hypothetical protein